jgi:hypothetical protein
MPWGGASKIRAAGGSQEERSRIHDNESVCFFGAVVNPTTAANGHAIIVENTEHIIYLFLKDLTHIIFYEHV